MQNNRPLVSVLIPAFNVETYLPQALQAVMEQTYNHLEIIVIDDGSTDGTWAVMQEYAKRDNRIRIVQNPHNMGLIKTLNNGIGLCQGAFIARTDADDIAYPHWIETILATMLANPKLLAVSSYLECFYGSDDVGLLGKHKKDGEIMTVPINHQDIQSTLIQHCCMSHPSILIRKEVFDDYHLAYDEHYPHAEDYKLWYEISKIGELANIPQVLVKYRLHAQQVSSSKAQFQEATAKKIQLEILNHHLEQCGVAWRLPAKLYYEDVVLFAQQKHGALDSEIFNYLLYQLYLSLYQYRLIDLWDFWFNPVNQVLSKKQKIKIVKKFLRPWKYEGLWKNIKS